MCMVGRGRRIAQNKCKVLCSDRSREHIYLVSAILYSTNVLYLIISRLFSLFYFSKESVSNTCLILDQGESCFNIE